MNNHPMRARERYGGELAPYPRSIVKPYDIRADTNPDFGIEEQIEDIGIVSHVGKCKAAIFHRAVLGFVISPERFECFSVKSSGSFHSCNSKCARSNSIGKRESDEPGCFRLAGHTRLDHTVVPFIHAPAP